MAEVAERQSLLLTAEELFEITGAKTAAKQRARLVALAIPYRDGPARPLVSRAAAEDWLRGLSTRPAGTGRGPRLDLVR